MNRMPLPPGQWKGPRGVPFEAPPPRGYGGVAHALFPWLSLLLFAALVAVAVIALVRFSRIAAKGGGSVSRTDYAERAVPGDAALLELRARYARGEIDRDEYLQKAADLGSTRPIPPASS